MNETGARDIFEHLGVWNSEAVHSLNAFAKRDEYFCIPKDVMYFDYNDPAAEVRRKWTMDQVWAIPLFYFRTNVLSTLPRAKPRADRL
jgi:hypothetical protein